MSTRKDGRVVQCLCYRALSLATKMARSEAATLWRGSGTVTHWRANGTAAQRNDVGTAR
jgi:hypothetical protein